MAGEWRTARFEGMAQLVRDAIPPSEASGLPYIGLEHIGEGSLSLLGTSIAEDATSLKTRFNKGDILFGKLRPYFRKVIRAPFPGICSTDIWVVRPRPGVDAGFLFYLMASDLFVEPVVRASEGTRMPRAQWEYACALELPLPPLPEQRAIAHILGTLDDKIELNRRMNETLEAMARALFKSWFIDFDPVRRNMARASGQNQPVPGHRPLSSSGRGLGDEGAQHGRGNYRGGYNFSGLVERARALRRQQTSAEGLFWELVRDRRFLGLKFRRQHQIGNYIADFYCHQHRLVIEFDGGVHVSKRQKDHKRDAWMKAQGLQVLRFPNEQLLDDPASVLEAIARALSPLPLGEGSAEGSIEGLEARLPSPAGRRVGVEGVVEGTAFDRLFPDSFQDSPLGKIPSGWNAGKLHEIIDLHGGGTPKTSVPEFWNGTIPWFSVVDAPRPSDVFVVDTEKKITEAGLESCSAKLLPTGTTVISARGTVGRLALLGKPMAVNQSCYGIRPKHGTGDYFTYFCLRDKVDELSQSTHGTVFDTITRGTFKVVDVVIPTDSVTRKFDEAVSPFLGRILSNLLECKTLAALRDALLPKLISGEIRVKDAGKFIGRARD